MRCGEEIKRFTSSVMWAVWTEEESHETEVLKNKNFEKSWKKNFRKKILEKKCWKKN